MSGRSLLITGGRVIDPSRKIDEELDILIENGKISSISKGLVSKAGKTADVINAKGKIVIPGLVDMHTHLRDPGNPDEETIFSGTRSAAIGGFTSVACMANTTPVADEPSIINYIASKAKADDDAKYANIMDFNAAEIGPQIAKPHTVDNVCPVEEVEGTPIQQGFIGTCTNGRLEDFEIAARILKGKKINSDTRLILAPASKAIMMELVKTGIYETLMDAGGTFVTPGCGPCVGTHNGVPSDGENVISTANRNFKGRMGNTNSFIYLGSPATVAASVINGKITDPRKFF